MNDDRMYAALEADDCEADALMRGVQRAWRKEHRVCEECLTEDGEHESTCSHYGETDDGN